MWRLEHCTLTILCVGCIVHDGSAAVAYVNRNQEPSNIKYGNILNMVIIKFEAYYKNAINNPLFFHTLDRGFVYMTTYWFDPVLLLSQLARRLIYRKLDPRL
jgi:hypothetical protein